MSTASLAAVPTSSEDVRVRALFGVFVASGVCGLIYESIWSHYLKLFVGHAAYAQTVVLVVFIGGMALGAWLIGRFAQRVRSPLIGYALVEAVIGVVSLVFHKAFVAGTDWAYATLLPAACVPESPCAAQWLFAALMILPQSILLGTTFPLMTTGVLRLSPREPGRRVALLYFLNSIGAAAGVLLSGFVLIPALGLPGSLLTAGLMNIAVACVAWMIAKAGDEGVVPSQPTSAVVADESMRRTLIVVAALTGLSSFVYEIVWIRMLSLVVGGSTHAFELMLAAFIFGLAMGGLWVRTRIDRFRDLIHALAVVQVLMGVAAVATLALYDGMFDFMGWLLGVLRRDASAYIVYNVVNHGLALAIMLPATFLAGMTFPLITTALLRGRDGERAIGYTYAANTLGSIVGVVIAVHFALPMLGVKGGLVLGAAVDIVLGIALLAMRGNRERMRTVAVWSGVSAAALLFVALAVPVLPERMASGVYRNGRAKLEADRQILFHRDGKTSSISFLVAPTFTSITTNGKPDASISRDAAKPIPDELTMVLTGLLPLSYKPEARTAAVIGFGSGLTTATLLGSPVLERVDTIEIEPQMVEGARLFGALVAPAYEDRRSRLVIDDAKSYFARSSLRYDLIISEPSNPWVSGVAGLFTQEFYARVKRQLETGGLFVQWIQIYEFNDALLATILRALDAEFGDYRVYAANDGDLIIVAATTSLPERPRGTFAQWTTMRPLVERVRLASVDEIDARRIAGRRVIRPFLAAFGGGTNSDYYPLVDQAAPKARFAAEMANGVMRVAIAGVPIEEMLGGEAARRLSLHETPVLPPARLTMLQSASATASYLVSGTWSGQVAPMLPRDAGLVRALLWNCASMPPRVRVSDLLLDIAETVNPYLPASDAAAVWRGLLQAPCASRLVAEDRDWIALFDAVARRDAGAMATLGAALSARGDASAQLRGHATLAAATGMLASERHADADKFLAAMLPWLPESAQKDPSLRVLRALANAAAPQHAAALR